MDKYGIYAFLIMRPFGANLLWVMGDYMYTIDICRHGQQEQIQQAARDSEAISTRQMVVATNTATIT
jgi:hypothetical protein